MSVGVRVVEGENDVRVGVVRGRKADSGPIRGGLSDMPSSNDAQTCYREVRMYSECRE